MDFFFFVVVLPIPNAQLLVEWLLEEPMPMWREIKIKLNIVEMEGGGQKKLQKDLGCVFLFREID